MAHGSLQQLEDLISSGYISDTEYIRRKIEIQYDFIHKLFSYFDHNHDNTITFVEFQNLVFEIGENMTESQVRDCFNQLDPRNYGTIARDDFINWWASRDIPSDQFVNERLRVIKAKLNSKLFMQKVFESGKRYTGKPESHVHEIQLDNDENLAVSLNIDAGTLTKSEAHIRLRHKRDPQAAAAFRAILGKDETYALASMAFTCKNEVNLNHLNEASKYLSVIMKCHMDNEKLPVEEFKWHTTEEDNVRYLRASAVLPVEFSMMGAGLLGSVGVQDLALDLDFGLGSSRLTFKAAVSRGCIALVDDFIPNKDTKQFATFFLNYFCGAKLKFQFSSVEEAMTHFAASNFIKNHQDTEFKNIILVGQKLVNSQRPDTHLELLQHILDFFVSKPQRLQYFQAAWFATKCAKDNVEKLASITVVVGDELFEVDINIPKLFELLPNYEVAFNSGLFDKTEHPRLHVLSPEVAAGLPQRKTYHKHEEHELILKNQLFEWVEDYWCDECDNFGSLWCYYCPDCMYIVHPEHVINSQEQVNV